MSNQRIAEQELTRIKALIQNRKDNGYRDCTLGEFLYGKHPVLGQVSFDPYSLNGAGGQPNEMSGPIEEIVVTLAKQGVQLFFSRELRSGKGGGVVTKITAKW